MDTHTGKKYMTRQDDHNLPFASHHEAERLTDTPLIRVMALHALKYCERLFYLEEVEEIRRADARIHSGRRLHDDLDKGEVRSIELASERLGLRGKADCIHSRNGRLMVYEHKRGRSNNGEAWPPDRMQVLAYSLLLAESSGEKVEEARIRYHADNKTVRITCNLKQAEEEVKQLIRRARELRSTTQRPPINVDERLCRTCSLAPVCLPEEDRFASNKKKRPRRLFPEHNQGQIVHVVEQGAVVNKRGDQLIINLPDGSSKPLPGMTICSLVLHGNVQISTQSLHFCAANEVGVHWLSYSGRFVGSLVSGTGSVQRKVRQYQALVDKRRVANLSIRLAEAKIANQLRYVLRATRNAKESRDDIQIHIDAMRTELTKLDHLAAKAKDVDTDHIDQIRVKARASEAVAAKKYFRCLSALLQPSGSDLMHFTGRNRRPPRDPFNAALSFGYALLYRDSVNALLAVGLEPAFGFMHTPRSAAYPLALDLVDLFRVGLWDIPLIGSVNRNQWVKEDFTIADGYVWLNPNGRRKAISLYESRKQEKWKHPVLEYSLSYGRSIELEARLLEKEWTDGLSLFAKSRLR